MRHRKKGRLIKKQNSTNMTRNINVKAFNVQAVYRGAENIQEWLFASEFTNEHRQEGVQIVRSRT